MFVNTGDVAQLLARRELRRAHQLFKWKITSWEIVSVCVLFPLSLVQLICISKVCVERVPYGVDTESSDSLSVQERERENLWVSSSSIFWRNKVMLGSKSPWMFLSWRKSCDAQNKLHQNLSQLFEKPDSNQTHFDSFLPYAVKNCHDVRTFSKNTEPALIFMKNIIWKISGEISRMTNNLNFTLLNIKYPKYFIA
jgi:hypothetical protein